MKPFAPLELKLPSHESSLERLVKLYFAYVSCRRQGKTPETTCGNRNLPASRRADFAFQPLAQPSVPSQPPRPLKAAWH